jgi:hypothetical protein
VLSVLAEHGSLGCDAELPCPDDKVLI